MYTGEETAKPQAPINQTGEELASPELEDAFVKILLVTTSDIKVKPYPNFDEHRKVVCRCIVQAFLERNVPIRFPSAVKVYTKIFQLITTQDYIRSADLDKLEKAVAFMTCTKLINSIFTSDELPFQEDVPKIVRATFGGKLQVFKQNELSVPLVPATR